MGDEAIPAPIRRLFDSQQRRRLGEVPIAIPDLIANGERMGDLERQVALLRHLLGEYMQGNEIVDGYWYSPERSGLSRYEKQTCPECDGKGGILVDSMILYGVHGGEDWDRCPTCEGKGTVLVAEDGDDEIGAPHYRNDPATPDELALWESVREEKGT